MLHTRSRALNHAASNNGISQCAITITPQHRFFKTAQLVSGAALALLTTCGPSSAELIVPPLKTYLVEGHLQPCKAGTSCVSSSNFLSPSMFLAPFSFDPQTTEMAVRCAESWQEGRIDQDRARNLCAQLKQQGAVIVEADSARGYVAAQVPFKLAAGQQDVDDIEFLFVEGNKVLFRSEAHKNVPSPPFCFIKGCISGPGNRGRLETLRDQLGWNSMEPDDEKKWVPILMH